MNEMKRLFFLLCCALFGAGCELIEYHPYEVRLEHGNHDLNAAAIARIESACRDRDTVRFVMMGDAQRFYDETRDFVRHINRPDQDSIDFVILGGDLSDFGLTREFEWIHDIMKGLKVPYVALIGNHDLLGNGLQVFRAMYGDINFSFVAGDTKFLCLNTNALEFDYSEPVPDFVFIENEIGDTVVRDYRRTVAVMHAQPYGEQFNNNVAKVFQAYLKKSRNLSFCLHAHAHGLMVNDFFDDGITYYGCSCMKDRSYLLFTLTEDSYRYEVVYY